MRLNRESGVIPALGQPQDKTLSPSKPDAETHATPIALLSVSTETNKSADLVKKRSHTVVGGGSTQIKNAGKMVIVAAALAEVVT